MDVRQDKSSRPILVVVGLIRDGNGKVLVQHRMDAKFPDADKMWEFPGGQVEFGESPEEALAREFREEIVCEVHIGRLLPVPQSRVWARADGVRVHYIVFCYECWYLSGTPIVEPGKSKAIAWKTPAEIAEMKTLPGVPAFLEAACLLDGEE